MNHLFLIDPIQKLNIKKDSSLYLANALKMIGEDVFLLFPNELYYTNEINSLKAYSFELEKADEFYFESLKIKEEIKVPINNTTIHMRLDPPFDMKYLGSLWLLEMMKTKGAKIVNDSLGIMGFNEKLMFTQFEIEKHPAFFGSSLDQFKTFCEQMQEKLFNDLIFKPSNLYSGIGIQKKSLSDKRIDEFFIEYSNTYDGQILVQPFIEDVYNGEVRVFYYKDSLVGSILKLPQGSSFLSNIAQGAEFIKYDISIKLEKDLLEITSFLSKRGVDLVAFDVLDGKVNEVNVTCPGLLNEISKAYGKNLALEIVKNF